MSETTTVMPTSDQLDYFRTALRTAFLNRNAPVQPGWPSRGTALDAIEAAWGAEDQLNDVNAAMSVIDPDWRLMSQRDQAWMSGIVYDALIDLP